MNTYTSQELLTLEEEQIKFPYIEKQDVLGKTLLVYMDNFRSEDWFGVRGWMRKTKNKEKALWLTSHAHDRYLTLVRPGDIVFDCGANEGYLTLLFASLVGEEGRVLAFEPNPNNIKVARKTLELNGFSNRVQIIQSVVSHQTQSEVFFSHEVVSCGKSNKSGALGHFSVPAVCLNSYAYLEPNFVKVDVEGYELPVVRGAEDVLRLGTTFEIELHLDRTTGIHMRDWYGFDPNEIYRLFWSHNYSITYGNKEVLEGEEPCGAVYCTKKGKA